MLKGDLCSGSRLPSKAAVLAHRAPLPSSTLHRGRRGSPFCFPSTGSPADPATIGHAAHPLQLVDGVSRSAPRSPRPATAWMACPARLHDLHAQPRVESRQIRPPRFPTRFHVSHALPRRGLLAFALSTLSTLWDPLPSAATLLTPWGAVERGAGQIGGRRTPRTASKGIG